MLVSCNTPKNMHRDINNDYYTKNYVVPLIISQQGGELWIELKEGDVVQGQIEKRLAGGQKIYGQLRPLKAGESIEFGADDFTNSRMDWRKDCSYSLYSRLFGEAVPRRSTCLLALHDNEFPLPLSQLPEFNGKVKIERPSPEMSSLQVSREEVQPVTNLEIINMFVLPPLPAEHPSFLAPLLGTKVHTAPHVQTAARSAREAGAKPKARSNSEKAAAVQKT